MPLREVEEKFTRSEISCYSWRSQEQYWQFKKRIEKYDEPPPDEPPELELDEDEIDVDAIYASIEAKHSGRTAKPKKKPRKEYSGKYPQGLPDKFYNKEGEIDLSKVTGEEAFRYFAKLGIPLPVIKRF